MHDHLTAAPVARVTVVRSAKIRFWPAFCAICAIGALSACRGDDSTQGAETGGSAGAAGAPTGGSTATGGAGASGDDSGGSATGGDQTGSEGGIDDDDAGTTVVPLCVFHTDPPPDNLMDELDGSADDVVASDASTDDVVDGGGATSEVGPASESDASTIDASAREASSPRDASAGDARTGDGAVSNTTIAMQTNPFIGRYLSDGAGRTLYIYAGDLPGDCNDAPISNCDSTLATARCADAWPIFEGRPRILGTGLSDDAFGTIMRADGLYQATYFGWPLYYYKNDTMPLVLNGQNRAKSWWAATIMPAGIVIMKDSSATPQKYVADGNGRTLYTFAQDTKGTDTANPASACTGTCLDSYQPFSRNRLSVVTSLELTDFTIFVRPDGRGQQLAYKGSPLYHATADVRAGQMNGVAAPDWAIILQ